MKRNGKAVSEREEIKKKFNDKYDEVEFKEKGGNYYLYHKG